VAGCWTGSPLVLGEAARCGLWPLSASRLPVFIGAGVTLQEIAEIGPDGVVAAMAMCRCAERNVPPARQPGLLALEAGTRRISAALATRPTEQPSGPHCIRLAISSLYAAVLTNLRSE